MTGISRVPEIHRMLTNVYLKQSLKWVCRKMVHKIKLSEPWCKIECCTNFGRLLLEKTLRGQDRWRCLEIQLRMLSHSAVPFGGGPSSRCNNTSCFCALTALPSSIRSNWDKETDKETSEYHPLKTRQHSVHIHYNNTIIFFNWMHWMQTKPINVIEIYPFLSEGHFALKSNYLLGQASQRLREHLCPLSIIFMWI